MRRRPARLSRPFHSYRPQSQANAPAPAAAPAQAHQTMPVAFTDPFFNTFDVDTQPWHSQTQPWSLSSSSPCVSADSRSVQAQHAHAVQAPQIRLDVIETDAEFRVIADLPGVALKDLRVDVDARNVLRISATHAEHREYDDVVR